MSALPCERDDETDIECWVCEDTGEFVPTNSDIRMPCTDCYRGDWTWQAEEADLGRRGPK